jgi:hypothetical protein
MAMKDKAREMIIKRLKVLDSLSLWERVRERAGRVEK